jgi:hypothetical protein
MYIIIIIMDHFGLSTIIMWTIEGRGVVDMIAIALTD